MSTILKHKRSNSTAVNPVLEPAESALLDDGGVFPKQIVGNYAGTGNLENMLYNVATAGSLSTGIISGGVLSANTTTTFNISAGIAYFTNGTYTGNNFVAKTNITITNIATEVRTYVLLNNVDVVEQQSTPPTPQDFKNKIYLGYINHYDNATITNIVSEPHLLRNPSAIFYDYLSFLGLRKKPSLIQTNGANASFNFTATELFGLGINYANDTTSPNRLTVTSQNPVQFRQATRDEIFTAVNTDVDILLYDNGGVLTGLAQGNDPTTHRVFLTKSGEFVVQYGQVQYNTSSDANNPLIGLASEDYVVNPILAVDAILIGVIVARRNGTDFEDTNRVQFYQTYPDGTIIYP